MSPPCFLKPLPELVRVFFVFRDFGFV